MASGLIIIPNYMPAFNRNGAPLSGALMNFYVDGTTTRRSVYSDAGLTTAHPNPVPADSSGVFPAIYADSSLSYTVAVTDALGVPLASYEGVTSSYGGPFSVVSALTYGARGDGVTDDTAALQAWVIASRGRIAYLPKPSAYYKITAAIIINTVVGGSALPFTLISDGPDANGGSGGATIRSSGTDDAIRIVNNGNTDTFISITGIDVQGDAVNAAGGNGINVQNCANVHISRCWVQGFRNAGILLYQCYGSTVSDCYVFKNRIYGIYANEQFNGGFLRRNRALENGTIWSQTTANIAVTGSLGYENLAPVLEDNDVSYAGGVATWYRRSDSGLTSIVVLGGVATATTATAHGRTTNDIGFVSGATVDTNLNTLDSITLTVTGPTTFTFTTTAANGTYTESTLRIAPWSAGLQINNSHGLSILGHYCEDCGGPSIYMGGNTLGHSIRGGYIQGTLGSGLVHYDTASPGIIEAVRFTGAAAGISSDMAAGPHGMNISSSISFANGASIKRLTLKFTDGQYYASAAPTTGTWTQGDYVRNISPTVGQPLGWSCTVSGAPGTWVAWANL